MQFDDGKSQDALRTIGEVSKALGIRQHVLRYWEEQFPMLRPMKRSGGRRYYRADDVELVATIDRLVHREGYTLKGARKALAGGAALVQPALPSTPPPAGFATELRAMRDGFVSGGEAPAIVPQLRDIRNKLAAALAEA
jgi:DNA-binding transcriptional MerR regulator